MCMVIFNNLKFQKVGKYHFISVTGGGMIYVLDGSCTILNLLKFNWEHDIQIDIVIYWCTMICICKAITYSV